MHLLTAVEVYEVAEFLFIPGGGGKPVSELIMGPLVEILVNLPLSLSALPLPLALRTNYPAGRGFL